MRFSTPDYLVFATYCLLILEVGLFVSRDKSGQKKNAEDYFLASKSLSWWTIGSSIIAANISAGQFIGIEIKKKLFQTTFLFAILASIVCLIAAVLNALFW